MPTAKTRTRTQRQLHHCTASSNQDRVDAFGFWSAHDKMRSSNSQQVSSKEIVSKGLERNAVERALLTLLCFLDQRRRRRCAVIPNLEIRLNPVVTKNAIKY